MKASTIAKLQSIVIARPDFNKNKVTGEYEWSEVEVSPTVIVNEDGVFISAEDGKHLADYYGEFKGGDMWVDPELEKAIKKLGLAYDWENAGTLVIFED